MVRQSLQFKNRISIVTLGMVTLAGLVTSISSPANAATPISRAFAGTTLNVLVDATPRGQLLLSSTIIKDFEKASGMTINVDAVPESGVITKALLALGAGQGQYDVIENGAKSVPQEVDSNWLLPLDKYYADSANASFMSGFSQGTIKSLSYKDHSYVTPFNMGGVVLYYNKEMLKAAKLKTPPNTTEQLVDAARRLNSSDHFGVCFRGTRASNSNSFGWIMLWMLNGGRWDPSGTGRYDVLTDAPAIKTAQQYQVLSHYASPGIASLNFDDCQTQMAQGKVALWLDDAALGPALEIPAKSTVVGKVGYSVLTGKAAGDEKYVPGAVWGYSIAKTTTRADAAWELIKYLSGKDVNLATTLAGASAPARTDVLDDPGVIAKLNPSYIAALKLSWAHVNPAYSPLISQGGAIRSALALAVSQILSGSSPTGAMTQANNTVKQLTK